jgi:hypothetical protein
LSPNLYSDSVAGMDIPELSDYIIKVVGEEQYVGWGRYQSDSSDVFKWVLCSDNGYGYPFTYQEALNTIPNVQKSIPNAYEVVSRTKSAVTLVKA